MKKQIIAIDVDDTIADSTDSLRLLVNSRVGINLTPDHYRVPGDMWGYYERVWASHGLLDKIDFKKYYDEMIVDQSHVPLLPGAAQALSELAKRFDLVLITARDPSWKPATVTWLKDKFGDLFSDVYFAGQDDIKDAMTKGQQAAELGAFLLIDDNPKHCLSAIEEGLEAILFNDMGWSSSAPLHLHRCKDWPAVLEYFDGIR